MRWSKLRWNGYAVCVFVLLLGACSQATAAPTSAPATAAPAADTAQPTAAPTSAPTAAPTSAPLSGEVSFLTFGSPAQAAAYQALAAAFEARYLGTKVNIISLADNEEDYHAKLSTELAGGQPPEVVLLDYDAAARYFAAGAFQSLSGDLAQSTLIHPTDFYTPATSSYQWQGQQMCLPLSASSVVVYYNKKLFDAAGQAYPKAGWTWDQFIATAKALTRPPDQFGVGMDRELNNVLPFIWQNGGELFSPDLKQLTLDTSAATGAIQWWVDWQVKDHVAASAVQEQSLDSGARFQNGQLGMFLDSSDSLPDFRAITDFDWDVGPLPQSQRPATILKSFGQCLTAKGPRADLGWKLIEFSSSPDGQKLMAAAGLIVPANIQAAQSPAFLNPNAKPAHSQVWLDAIPLIHTVPPLPHWPDIEETANTELENAFYGNETVAVAVQAISARARIALQP